MSRHPPTRSAPISLSPARARAGPNIRLCRVTTKSWYVRNRVQWRVSLMRAAASLLPVLLALTACSDAPQQAETNNAAATDIEALPPDESVDTPSDELANEAAEPTNTDNAAY